MPYTPTRFSVSVKGVVVRDGRVVLLMNERDEWELPGGRLEPGEQPETCVVREVQEETGLETAVVAILDSWVSHIGAGPGVLIVTYGCAVIGDTAPVLSHEHQRIGTFSEPEASGLAMPDGYKRSISAWYSHLRSGARA
ncbi:NUDIX hydrolase [Actinopolymorpha sp. B17G11]|uniref:NUDIX hydrolase n=1 Tax=Actinopolymorpha sp. B17G11 TaxID=3160861 RepID=UPI0032E4518E